MKRTGAPHGDELGWINPLAYNSAICFLSSTSSFIGILYDLFEIGGVPGNNSLMNSISQLGGRPGNSSEKNVWVILNNLNLIQRCSLYLVEHTDLVGGNCCHEFDSGPIFSS
jgi:hypothetical protein